MGELSLIEKFRAQAPTHPAIIVGPGHDCAVLNWPASTDLLFKIDQIVEGTHFVLSGKEASRPFDIGWKAMAKACSDIAAAGGWPVAATVALNLQLGSSEKLAMGVYDGLVECCKCFDFGLAGGDFSTSQIGLSVVVSMLGKVRRGGAWTRGGAKPGDALLVTGALGGSRFGKHLHFTPRLDAARRIRELVPRGVHACIDITDGLSRDLRHICAESQCGARVERARVPLSAEIRARSASEDVAFRHALSDGEDFELLLAVEPSAAKTLLKKWPRRRPPHSHNIALTRIGEIVPKEGGVTCLDADGAEHPLPDLGYEHHV